MKSKGLLLRKSLLYLILDRPVFPKGVLGSVGIIQLRDKVSNRRRVFEQAAGLARSLAKSRTLFIVNDYADIALLSGADGVHLGQGDLPLKEARKMMGKGKIIGVSCHNLSQAVKAQEDGADYIGIGPVYRSATKPECEAIGIGELRRLRNKISIPYFAIGNINRENLGEVINAGCGRAAVCRAILEAGRPDAAAKNLFSILNQAVIK